MDSNVNKLYSYTVIYDNKNNVIAYISLSSLLSLLSLLLLFLGFFQRLVN